MEYFLPQYLTLEKYFPAPQPHPYERRLIYSVPLEVYVYMYSFLIRQRCTLSKTSSWTSHSGNGSQTVRGDKTTDYPPPPRSVFISAVLQVRRKVYLATSGGQHVNQPITHERLYRRVIYSAGTRRFRYSGYVFAR